MNLDHLAALVAVVDEGSFDGAAHVLRVTPSAVSQRIKALEKAHGRLLVVRSSPCRATGDGEVLLRFARQVSELAIDALAELDPTSPRRRPLPVVVNADSLATWFAPVLTDAAGWTDIELELLIEIEDHGTHVLRSGRAVGAVTSDPVVVTGCTVEPLGVLRYLPVSAPGLAERHTTGSGVDWQRIPVLRFSTDDDLQHRLLARHGVHSPDVTHVLPSNHGFLAAIHAGLGWGLAPEEQVEDAVRRGDLVRLDARDHVDVHLAWQTWKLPSRGTDRLTQAVRRAARAGLRRERP